jgi:hypothetical protein
VVAPGRYVISLAGFSRKISKAEQDYLSGRWKVHSGGPAGKQFWANVSMDFSKNGTVVRWQMLIEAMGIEEEIELGSSAEGTAREGDRNIAKHMRGRAFVAVVEKTRDGQYWNNGIQKVIPERSWTDAERDLVDELDNAREQQAEPEDYAGEPPSGGRGGEQDPDPQDDFGPEDYGDAPQGGGRAAPIGPAEDDDPF